MLSSPSIYHISVHSFAPSLKNTYLLLGILQDTNDKNIMSPPHNPLLIWSHPSSLPSLFPWSFFCPVPLARSKCPVSGSIYVKKKNCLTLSKLGKRGLLYGNVWPGNILLSRGGNVDHSLHIDSVRCCLAPVEQMDKQGGNLNLHTATSVDHQYLMTLFISPWEYNALYELCTTCQQPDEEIFAQTW